MHASRIHMGNHLCVRIVENIVRWLADWLAGWEAVSVRPKPVSETGGMRSPRASPGHAVPDAPHHLSISEVRYQMPQ